MQTKEEIKGVARSFKNAFSGVVLTALNERNFRIHICMAIYVSVFSLIGKVGMPTFLKFLICFGMVFASELFNTAIEILCDEICRDYNENIKKIKDISAGAVLLAALFSAILGLCVFLSGEVLSNIGNTFMNFPIVAVLVFMSLPLAVLFIVKRGKK